MIPGTPEIGSNNSQDQNPAPVENQHKSSLKAFGAQAVKSAIDEQIPFDSRLKRFSAQASGGGKAPQNNAPKSVWKHDEIGLSMIQHIATNEEFSPFLRGILVDAVNSYLEGAC